MERERTYLQKSQKLDIAGNWRVQNQFHDKSDGDAVGEEGVVMGGWVISMESKIQRQNFKSKNTFTKIQQIENINIKIQMKKIQKYK